MRRLLVITLVAGALGAWWALRPPQSSSPGGLSPDLRQQGVEPATAGPRGSTHTPSTAAPGVSGHEDRSDARTLRGRAEDWWTGEGIEGVRLLFQTDREPVEVSSGPGGEFLSPPRARGAELAVEVHPPEGYWTVDHGPTAASGAQLYRVRLAPLTHGPLRVQLLDVLTGEPLPDYVAQLRSEDGWSQVVQTDGEGRVRTEVLFAEGPIDLWSTEEERGVGYGDDALGRIEFRPAGASPAPRAVSIESGPTYWLELELPSGLDASKLSAYIESADWIDQVELEFSPGQQLRRGDRPWVRFPEDMSWKSEPRLLLLGPGGRWKGVAEIDASPGRHTAPVYIRVDRQAQLLGTVLDARGEAVARAEVELTADGAEEALTSRWTQTNGRGNFSLEGLSPGSYSLSLRHVTAGALAERVQIREDDEERREFRLEPFHAAGDLSGVVRSTSGEFTRSAQVVLRPRSADSEEFLPRRSQRLSWELEGAEYVARFRFSQVALAEYEVTILAPRSPYLVEPAELLATPPDSGLELVIRDEREVFSLTFLPLDADTGRWLGDTQLQLRGAGGKELYSGPTSGWSSSTPFGEDAVLSWRLSKDGYVTERGDRRAFTGRLGATAQQAVVRLRRH